MSVWVKSRSPHPAGARVAQWWEHSPPTTVARSNPNDETMCEISLLLVLSLAQKAFSPRPPSFPLLKTNTSKLQIYLDKVPLLFQLDFAFPHLRNVSSSKDINNRWNNTFRTWPVPCTLPSLSGEFFGHNTTQLHSQLVRSIRFYPANDGPCRRIWTVFYSKDCQARFLKVTTLQRVQLLKDYTGFRRFNSLELHRSSRWLQELNTFFESIPEGLALS